MRHIRPWELFQHLGQDRWVEYYIPTHKGRESETISSLETLLLVSVIRFKEVKTVLELGTGLGYNAMHLGANTRALIVTIDKEKRGPLSNASAWQADLFTLEPQKGEMVFCDINYTPETLAKATEFAFAYPRKVIAWHDYGHPELPQIKPFLDRLAEERELVHVEDSFMVFHFDQPLEAKK